MAFEVPQPMNYGQPENLGVTIGQGLGSLGNILAQAKQQEEAQAAKQQLQQFQQAFGQAYATGDRDTMRQLAAQFPGQFDQVQKGITILNSENKENVGNAAADLRMAAASGDENAIRAAAQRNASTLEGLGTNADDLVNSFKENPQQFNQLADMIGLHALGPDKYFDVMDKQQTQQLNQQKLAEQIRSNQAGESVQWANVNIAKQNAALRGMELKDKSLDRQIAQETNLVKLQELKQKQQDNQGKLEQAKADRQAAGQSAVDTFSTALDSLNDIEKSPGLEKAVGVRSAFPTIPGSEAANFEARLDTFKAQTFLPMVSSLKGMGALSDAEGKKLSDAVGALSPKMSEKAFRDSLQKIRGTLESKLGTVKKQYGYQEPQQAAQPPAGGNFSSLWGD